MQSNTFLLLKFFFKKKNSKKKNHKKPKNSNIENFILMKNPELNRFVKFKLFFFRKCEEKNREELFFSLILFHLFSEEKIR